MAWALDVPARVRSLSNVFQRSCFQAAKFGRIPLVYLPFHAGRAHLHQRYIPSSRCRLLCDRILGTDLIDWKSLQHGHVSARLRMMNLRSLITNSRTHLDKRYNFNHNFPCWALESFTILSLRLLLLKEWLLRLKWTWPPGMCHVVESSLEERFLALSWNTLRHFNLANEHW